MGKDLGSEGRQGRGRGQEVAGRGGDTMGEEGYKASGNYRNEK